MMSEQIFLCSDYITLLIDHSYTDGHTHLQIYPSKTKSPRIAWISLIYENPHLLLEFLVRSHGYFSVSTDIKR
jgi:hypothetical protein